MVLLGVLRRKFQERLFVFRPNFLGTVHTKIPTTQHVGAIRSSLLPIGSPLYHGDYNTVTSSGYHCVTYPGFSLTCSYLRASFGVVDCACSVRTGKFRNRC